MIDPKDIEFLEYMETQTERDWLLAEFNRMWVIGGYSAYTHLGSSRIKELNLPSQRKSICKLVRRAILEEVINRLEGE